MAPATQKFTVTDKAGSHVAGRKVKPGDVLPLTEEEARYPLIQGEIEPESKVREAASKTPKAALKDDKKAGKSD